MLSTSLLAFLFLLQAPDTAAARGAAVDALIQTQMQKREIPGLQLAVVQHAEIALLRSYGVADLEHAVPVDDGTVFMINSITKAFTGIAILQLVEQNKLDLEQSVGSYIEGLPVDWRGVTLRQLLTHQSGLPQIMDTDAHMISDRGDQASWEKVCTLPMESRPGQRFSYNQTNYLLLGKLIDHFGAEPFEAFVRHRQLEPAQMRSTVFGDARDVLVHAARIYARAGPGESAHWVNTFDEFPAFLRTAAGLNSTADDLAHWLLALQGGHLFAHAETLDEMWTAGLTESGATAGFSTFLNGYGLGWPIAVRDKHPAAVAVGGGRAAVIVYPADDLAVVILTNLRGAEPEAFIESVAALFVPELAR